MSELTFHGTTVLSIRDGNQVVMGADGQVTLQNTVMKSNARKVRRVYHGNVLVGFAGATADAFTLFEKFEARLETYNGNLLRAAVELAKDWRTDRMLRHLEALLMAVSSEHSLLISGNGDVIEPEEGIMAIGSGGMYALAAAKGLRYQSNLPLAEIVKQALTIAASIDIYTNTAFTIESL